MQHRRIIKRGPIVLATNEDGSMDPSSPVSQGLFLGDTRFLSLFRIHLNGLEPLLLGSSEESLFEASYLHINPEMTDLAPRPFSRHIDITPALPTCITDVVVDNLQIAGGCLGLHIRGEGTPRCWRSAITRTISTSPSTRQRGITTGSPTGRGTESRR